MERYRWEVKEPRKAIFLKLERDAVRDVNLQRDSDDLNYARKAMLCEVWP